eukprot:CAMPEP_0184863972 /NCGR_PEP_ID=MMETSP0580-20130426/13153_1 /TAXON_ID=1118495 /ORGANISM="Dactyliosolen fragilissimus" /LENGTH=203 /DNA_ID=CAMNT_0027362575 /DNA_START=90 /DNA_END=701 /DNA_ORIENTATION=+
MPIYFESWRRTCEEVGLDNFPLERFYDFAGLPVRDIFETLLNEKRLQNRDNGQCKANEKHFNYTAEQCEEIKRSHHLNIEAEGRKAGPIDIVVNIALKYYGKIPLAVASSGWRDHVLDGLERNGILHLFDTVVTADEEEVKRPKPSPDIFLVAAKRIKVDPSQCVGFEDANLGLRSISDAGFMYACDVRKFSMYPRNVKKTNT